MNQATALSTLKKYWGYEEFRSPQDQIIQSLFEGNDTIALLPTGGGKSLCYQLPAIILPGKTIVISPLIALMEDQVQALNKKGIKARSLNATLSYRQIGLILDDFVYGDLKILYISPERIKSEVFFKRYSKAKISLFAIDEAHCISQWGYDFRPSYLDIHELRHHCPNVPIIALTATATPSVLKDISEKLTLRNPSIFKKSFQRENLSFTVIRTEDKFNQLLHILNKVRGCGVIYVRNRKETVLLTNRLLQHRFSAIYYHGGMDKAARDKNQKLWMSNQVSLMVSTNAFGMGIDKPDVRLVVHLDVAPSPEEYYQEAGRAGRDGRVSFAVSIISEGDISSAHQQLQDQFPSMEEIAIVYDHLCRYYRIAYGDGKNLNFDFNISDFSKYCGKKPKEVYHILTILDKDGWIIMSEGLKEPTKVMFICSHEDLRFTDAMSTEKTMVVTHLLRRYEGLFSEFVKIDEWSLAKDLNLDEIQLQQILKVLKQEGIIDIQEKLTGSGISFLLDRPELRSFTIDMKAYKLREKMATDRLKSMTEYVINETVCRQLFILRYFGEKAKKCGRCDVCKGTFDTKPDVEMEQSVFIRINEILLSRQITVKEFCALFPHNKRAQVKSVLKKLENEHHIELSDKGVIGLKK